MDLSTKNRLDFELVKRGLVKSRTKAQELIKSGYVLCNGEVVNKSGKQILATDKIIITNNDYLKYVSRGGLKLEKALTEFGVDLHNKIVMDIGSSTGGFTDCAIQHGARKVIAIDVGTEVMDKGLRSNIKVELYENTNIKDLELSFFADVDYITIDVSFISIIKVFERIAKSNIEIEIIGLIKPQFECGKEIASKYKGVILDKKIHKKVISKTISKINKLGFFLRDVISSPIKGGDGNIEYLTYFTNRTNQNQNTDLAEIINNVFKSL